jgi:hypothetical protein
MADRRVASGRTWSSLHETHATTPRPRYIARIRSEALSRAYASCVRNVDAAGADLDVGTLVECTRSLALHVGGAVRAMALTWAFAGVWVGSVSCLCHAPTAQACEQGKHQQQDSRRLLSQRFLAAVKPGQAANRLPGPVRSPRVTCLGFSAPARLWTARVSPAQRLCSEWARA